MASTSAVSSSPINEENRSVDSDLIWKASTADSLDSPFESDGVSRTIQGITSNSSCQISPRFGKGTEVLFIIIVEWLTVERGERGELALLDRLREIFLIPG